MVSAVIKERAARTKEIIPGVRRVNLSTGEALPIFQSGGSILYLLESGLAVIERDNNHGEWDSLGYRRADSVFGERLQSAEWRPYHKRVTALTSSSLLRIERTHLNRVMDTDPEIAGKLRGSVELDSYAVEDRLALIEGTTLAERLPTVLLDMMEGSIDTRVLANQKLVAKAVGGDRATLNQMLMGLKRRGIILGGRVLAINGEGGLNALKAMSEGTSPVVSSNFRTYNGTARPMIPN